MSDLRSLAEQVEREGTPHQKDVARQAVWLALVEGWGEEGLARVLARFRGWERKGTA